MEDAVNVLCTYLSHAQYDDPDTIEPGLKRVLEGKFDKKLEAAIKYHKQCQKEYIVFHDGPGSSDVYHDKYLNWSLHQKLKEREMEINAMLQESVSDIDMLYRQKKVILDKAFQDAFSVQMSTLLNLLISQVQDSHINQNNPADFSKHVFMEFQKSGYRDKVYYHILHADIRLGAIQNACNKVGHGAEVIIDEYHRARIKGETFTTKEPIDTQKRSVVKYANMDDFSPEVTKVSEQELLKEQEAELQQRKAVTMGNVHYAGMDDL